MPVFSPVLPLAGGPCYKGLGSFQKFLSQLTLFGVRGHSPGTRREHLRFGSCRAAAEPAGSGVEVLCAGAFLGTAHVSPGSV